MNSEKSVLDTSIVEPVHGIALHATTLSQRDRSTLLTRIARDLVHAKLKKLHSGKIHLIEQYTEARNNTMREFQFGTCKNNYRLSAILYVTNPQFYCDLAFGGSIGAGESYMLHHWHCDNLTNLVRIMARNSDVMDDMETSRYSVSTWLRKSLHWLNRNTKSGSRNNISAHYDLGNDFFELFLDPSMMYSSGIFPNDKANMEQASHNKLKHICQQLNLNDQDHVLEIGTGWGGFAIYAAQNYGCKVTTTTISQQQYDATYQRIAELGLESQIELLKVDYRDLTGQYDKLVSIEMIEAVGHQYYNTFFHKCSNLLKADGAMLLQAITISDQRYEQAKHSVDFIQRYIFPGSCIPSISAILNSTRAVTDLNVVSMQDIGLHYAKTLQKWRERFFSNIEHVRKLGYTESFIKMWEFYLCYCEGGFRERVISDVHLLLSKPHYRLMPSLS